MVHSLGKIRRWPMDEAQNVNAGESRGGLLLRKNFKVKNKEKAGTRGLVVAAFSI